MLQNIAQCNLGWCYHKGEGVEKDLVCAVEWYQRAADQGDASAQFNLGWCYQHGEGVEKNLVLALKWYQSTADQGNEGAATK